jgi:hypothetical protein
MPRFYEEVEFDITPEEFIDSCSTQEKEELWEALKDDYDYPEISVNKNDNCLDTMFYEQVQKLIGNKHRLTVEEENLILSITNKL